MVRLNVGSTRLKAFEQAIERGEVEQITERIKFVLQPARSNILPRA
jgi:hypothetical protein